MTEYKCVARIWSGFSHFACNRNAKTLHGNKWFCGIHDPQKIAERDKIRNDKHAMKYDEKKRMQDEAKATMELQKKRAAAFLEIMAMRNDWGEFEGTLNGFVELLKSRK